MRFSLKRLVRTMQKDSLYGWKKVFAFTFLQNLKGTGNRVLFLILFLLALVSMPVLEAVFPASDTADGASGYEAALLEENGFAEESEFSENVFSDKGIDDFTAGFDGETSPIEHLYFYNEAQFPIENLDAFISKYPYFSEITVEIGEQDFEDWLAAEKNENSHYDMHVTLSFDMDGYFITCAAPTMSHLDREDLEAFEYAFRQYINVEKLALAGVSEEDLGILETPINGSIYQVNKEGILEEVDDSFIWNSNEYGISYGILLVTIFLVAFCAEGISVSVVTEKSSKIVETLLLSVRPMATIVGKVLASICILLAQFAGFFIGLAISCLINGYQQTGTLSFLPASAMKDFLSLEMFQGASPIHIVLALIILLTGLLLYGVLAGICGASVSRMEEIGEALKLYNLLYIVGAYFALAVTMVNAGGSSALNYAAYLFPLSAPFIVPTHLIIGKMPLWLGLVSLALLALVVALAFWLASRIYENMLFYNGTPMKIKDFVRMAKQSKKGGDAA